ncbi:MAG TPA: GlsB/YeaQ/YmgE family stress response membrane protein [Candidatus Udaeobacter sp.]|nr:GlsB/YeaQ/YmgE family stress response membrane protein [Candidatus Udaeobacter sp.]
MTFSKRGFGFWINMAIGMIGAVVGGFLFWLFHIDLRLAEIKITFEDLISAFVGSLLCIIVWRLIRRGAGEKEPNGP